MSEVLKIGNKEVVIDPDCLNFNESTLGEYIQKESGYYDYYGACLALAEKAYHQADIDHEKVFAERFTENKDMGGSDKYAELKTKQDPTVIELKEKITETKYVVKRLQQHLRSWDKNHDNAQSMGHMLRKTMDKLNADIMLGSGFKAEFPHSDKDSEYSSVEEESGFSEDLGIDDLV